MTAGVGDAPTDETERHDGVTIGLHWCTLILLLVSLGAILGLRLADGAATAERALMIHRTVGVLLWLVTLGRLTWKVCLARTVRLPAQMGQVQRLAARANEAALYILLIAQPITGVLQSVFRGRAFDLFGLSVPVIVARDRSLAHAFQSAHAISAGLLLALVGLHVGAALFHHFVLRDGVMGTMWPTSAQRARSARP